MNNTDADNNLSARVRRTLADLTVIRKSLLAISEQPENSLLSADKLDIELAGELKNVVDALRLLLWAYIKALSAQSGRSPHEVLSWYKMQLAVEMLRSASPRYSNQGFTPDPPSEFDRLVTGAMVVASRHAVPEPFTEHR